MSELDEEEEETEEYLPEEGGVDGDSFDANRGATI
jgi:hypothetical protein